MDPTHARQIPLTKPADALPLLAPARRRMSVIAVRDLIALSAFVPAWEELAAAALEPNVFYEHWMLLPALEAFGGQPPQLSRRSAASHICPTSDGEHIFRREEC